MRDIYSSATAILISFGLKDWTFSHGTMKDVLELTESPVPKLRKALNMKYPEIFKPSCLRDEGLLRGIGIDELARKLMTFAEFDVVFTWFRRVWCIQEIVLARSIIVHCEDQIISWDKIEELLLCLRFHGWHVWLMDLWRTMTGSDVELYDWFDGLIKMCLTRRLLLQLGDGMSDAGCVSIESVSFPAPLLRGDPSAIEAVPQGGNTFQPRRPLRPHSSQFQGCVTLLKMVNAALGFRPYLVAVKSLKTLFLPNSKLRFHYVTG